MGRIFGNTLVEGMCRLKYYHYAWAGAIPDAGGLARDRLLHHSHMITIRGDSYRLREKRRSGLFQKAAALLQPTNA